MKRFRLLLFAMLAVAVTALSWGTGVTYAEQDSKKDVKRSHEQDQAAAKKRADADAVKVRTQRDAAIKKRHDAQKAIQKIVRGEQPAAVSAPDNAGKENAK